MSLFALFAAIFVLVAFCVLGAYLERWDDRKRFNKGVCRHCGGRWRPCDSTRRRFKCRRCGQRLTSAHPMD